MASTFFSATSDEAEGMLTSDDDSVLVVLEFVGAKSFLLESGTRTQFQFHSEKYWIFSE